ncbi:MAG: tRNA-dihydrouridine synthase [Verrucomicrobia bacterium]|nr:tRNA-dihydrouridine synthase [Verrucomicrobiota bacterium]
MQDVTDLTFMQVIHRRGDPDLYFTEYFRVHRDSKLDKPILRSIDENPTGRPIIAQMIGVDIPSLVRSAKELEKHPIAAVDLNLGCPAPIVCSKNAGGGLLRNPAQIDEILKALRDAIAGRFTVKTRIGFDHPGEFERLLEVFARHPIDALTVHGRTVRELYRSEVHLPEIRQAVEAMPCPVIANGNVLSTRLARETAGQTGAAGLMIGRGAIRNPWIFRQLREEAAGQTPFAPTLRDILAYVEELFEAMHQPGGTERGHIARMKKFLNFIGQGIGENDAFLQAVRRAETYPAFWAICREHLDVPGDFPPEPARRALIDDRSERLAAAGS